jgi:2-polyprenyl-3-methyl-5-hydroxy-6-metoxy-1,4-benzoquinol methylase
MINNIIDHKYEWLNPHPTHAHTYILPEIVKLLPKGSPEVKVLDIGCGNGFTAFHLARMGFDVTGVDTSEKGIRIAKETYPGIRFEIASVYDNLSALINCIDIVIATEVIEHLFLPRLLIENAYKVLNPRGMLIITTPYHGYFKNISLSIFNKWDSHHTVNWEGGHIKFFSEKTMTELLISSGFKNISFHNVGRIPWLWKSMICKCFKI